MNYKISAKKQINCKHCKGRGIRTIDGFKSNTTVEYYCGECDGSGKKWKNINITLESLKDLLEGVA